MSQSDAAGSGYPDIEIPDLSKAQARAELARLAGVLAQANDAYHREDAPQISDGEYDALRRELKDLRPDSTLFDTATASNRQSSTGKIAHDHTIEPQRHGPPPAIDELDEPRD